MRKLPICPCNRRLVLNHPRSLDLIDDHLLDVFRQLVAGQAAWPLFLHGPPGRGKTSAALALCDIAATAGYWTVEGICDATMARSPDIHDIWANVETKDLAVLDELGTRHSVGDLHYGVVKKFADLREQHQHRVTVYVSNVPPKEIPGLYDGRIASRVLCGTVLRLEGEDRRFVRSPA